MVTGAQRCQAAGSTFSSSMERKIRDMVFGIPEILYSTTTATSIFYSSILAIDVTYEP
jgi:hypothetical protein